MRFGEELDEARLQALLTPDAQIHTVLTADAYGAGAADELVGRALAGLPRDDYALAGAIGHDVYDGHRAGARGYARFTHPDLRGPEGYADYLHRAAERSLERCGVDRFDLLFLHNPDRIGYTSEAVWEGMRALRDAGLTDAIGIAPGPANGFTLDLLACFERFGSEIDWAMVILNPLEPWPGEYVLPAAEQAGIDVIARVVDYGGLFHDDVRPGHAFAEHDHRLFRPDGWIEAGRDKLDRLRPIADSHGLSLLQLAAQWDLAHQAVRCVAPTLIQEPGPGARSIEDKRADLAATPAENLLSSDEVDRIRAIGDNTGSMALKGAAVGFAGDEQPDRWALTDDLTALGRRWGIEPERDLAQASSA
jgi:aryl-alcohol dehydrogenase-like predicted oxidoreductase